MTRVGGRTVEIGRSSDLEAGEGYTLEWDPAADQLNIIDEVNDNEIVIDMGEGIILEALRAGSEVKLPTYADNANAVQEDAQIWFNDGTGSDAAGVYHYDGGVVGPLETGAGSAPANLSGLTIDTDKDWGGYVITGAGHDGVQIPSVRELTVVDAEEGSATDWNTGGGAVSVQSSTVHSGSFAYQLDLDAAGNRVYAAPPSLANVPQYGDRVDFYIYLTDTDDQGGLLVFDDSLGFGGSQALEVSASNDDITIRIADSTNVSDGADISSHLNEWLHGYATFTKGEDGTTDIVFTVEDSAGNVLGNVTAAGEDLKAERGITLYAENPNIQATCYYDDVTITRRTREYLTDTQTGTTELGNEVTPSGGIHTGPQEATLNALRQEYATAPVDDGATQGDVSLLTLLKSGLDPAVYVERVLDGQGGAYGHQLQAALGRFARINANLSWEYDTLSDVPSWTGVDGGSGVWTFNVNSRPRRLHAEHDGSAAVNGGISSPVLVNPYAIGGVSVTFHNVSYTNNATENVLNFGIHSNSVDSTLNDAGNGFIYSLRGDGGGGQFEDFQVLSGGAKQFTNLTVDWSQNHDITIRFDPKTNDSEILVDGQLQGVVTQDISGADMRPAIQLQDDGSSTAGETFEVEQVTVEPLSEVLN